MRSKNSKVQKRLTFTPLPSSSLASATYDRAAAVVYEASPSPAKRRKMGESIPSDTNNGDGISAAENALPTPKRSSQTRSEGPPNMSYDDNFLVLPDADGDSESTGMRARKIASSHWVSRAKKSRIKTQRMLDFGVMATQSPNTQIHSPPQPHTMRPSRKPSKAHANNGASRNAGKVVGSGRRLRSGIFSSDSAVPPNGSQESDTSSETISSGSSHGGKLPRQRPEPKSSISKNSSLPKSPLSPRQTRSSAKALQRASRLPETSNKALAKAGKENTTLNSLSSDEEESDDMPSTLGSRQRRSRQLAGNKHPRDIDEVDNDDLLVMHTRKLRRPGDVSDVARDETDNDQRSAAKPSNEDTSDDDKLPRTPRRRQRPAQQMQDRRQSRQELDDLDLESLGSPAKESNDGSDADEVPRTPGRRLRFGQQVRDRPQTQQELEDLQEDLEFLGSSANPDAKRSSRRTGDPPKSARQKALDALKRRRAGPKDDSDDVEDRAPSHSRRHPLYDTESEGENPTNPEGDLDHGELTDPSEYEVSTREMFHADKDDEGFIASDDEGALGAPVDLPLEFSHLSHVKTKDLFKFAVEWMVQKKINPAFAISDEVYDLAFRRLDDEVRGLAGSKFTSSAWTPEFTRALQARPDIEYHPIGLALLPDKCDACNRSGHPATWDIKFGGMPYRLETLEDVSDNEAESDDGEDVNGEVYDAKGNLVPDANWTFHVGKFCKQNALTAHALAHWRYHLNAWVVDYLKAAGYCSAEKILERDDWSTKRRREFANKVVDKMEKRGEIASLWRDFRSETTRARNVGQSKWDRSSP